MRRSAMFISLSQSDTDIGGKEHRPEPVSRLDWVDGTRLDAHGCHSQATERSRHTVQIVQVLNHEGCRDTCACMIVGPNMLMLQRVAASVACVRLRLLLEVAPSSGAGRGGTERISWWS